MPLAFLGNIGFQEMLVILFIGLLMFGSRLPNVGRQIGRSVAQFKRGLSDMKEEMRDIEHDVDRRVDDELKRREPERAHAADVNVTDVPPATDAAAPAASESAPAATASTAAPGDGAAAAAPVSDSGRPPHGSNG